MAACRPNVLFILSDQHNAKVLGHEGHADVQTPNLDRLAAEGVRFSRAITQNPICTPSRVCWLSGQYCHNHGYYGLSGPNPGGLPSVPGHFRRAGYATAALGKIHCPEYWIEDDCDLFHETCGCSIGGRSAAYAQYLAERNLTHPEDHGGLQEFGVRGRQTVEGRPSKVPYEDSQEGWAVRRAREFMRDCAAASRPFFAHVSLPKPHQCYAPAQRFWDLYDEAALPLPPNADYEMAGKAPHLVRTASSWRRREWQLFEPKTFAAGRLRKLHGYLGNISHMDHAVGELLAWLAEDNLADDTIVIYSSDHGDYACEHGIMEKAPGICADAITRIPWIWRWPGRFAAGRVVPEIAETVDLANTLCALAGLPAMETADGCDLSHLLRGERGEVHRIGVTEFPWSRSVRKGDWRLVYYPREMFPEEYPDGFGELYNLAEDPWEMRNLYFLPEHAARARELERDLMDWLVTTTRPATAHPLPACESPQSHTRYHHTVNADRKTSPKRLNTLRGGNYL
ncbi:MAG: sulfatase-like hydrolase/transferase [Lentisphaeria bacterium]|nr:sulfatase-like hydrolase/transferase [Lentisphaeria bacterium]